ncbi:Uncharacterised protein [Mycobacteroides abscessus subsp. abscessus]|nr:Uncharacterised protein [Mycobacteroides abscessus subsp. abscessus]
MQESLATAEDLQTLIKRTLDGDDLEQAKLLLKIVSAWVRVIAGRQWPDAPTGVPDDVQAVVLITVARELAKPVGERVTQRVMGPFSVTFAPPPDGFFLPAELAILKRFRPASGLRTVGTSRGETGRPWIGRLRLGPHGSWYPGWTGADVPPGLAWWEDTADTGEDYPW